jgi:hypothetical protein
MIEFGENKLKKGDSQYIKLSLLLKKKPPPSIPDNEGLFSLKITCPSVETDGKG